MSSEKTRPHRPLILSWERTLVDESVASTLSTALHEVAKSAIMAKQPANVSLSIVTRKSFSSAAHLTNGTFDPNIFAAHFLDDTNFSPLEESRATPGHIAFLDATNERQGSRVALMLHTGIEDEQRIAHDLLREAGICGRPFLPGAHLSLGTLVEKPRPKEQKEIARYLTSLLPQEIWFSPVTQQTYSYDGLRAERIALSPVPAISPLNPADMYPFDDF